MTPIYAEIHRTGRKLLFRFSILIIWADCLLRLDDFSKASKESRAESCLVYASSDNAKGSCSANRTKRMSNFRCGKMLLCVRLSPVAAICLRPFSSSSHGNPVNIHKGTLSLGSSIVFASLQSDVSLGAKETRHVLALLGRVSV